MGQNESILRVARAGTAAADPRQEVKAAPGGASSPFVS